MSEIRLNRLTGEWVIIAPERAKRGGNLERAKVKAEVPAYVESCPFCPGNEAVSTGECYRDDGPDGKWRVRSFVNKFSVLSSSGEVAPGCVGQHGQNVNGVGLHEVIVESPRHDLSMAQLSLDQVQRVLKCYLHRFRAFHEDPRIRHVIIFKNHGADAGASQQHPHSQIVGMPIVPGQVVDRLERGQRFFDEAGACLACALIAQEQEHAVRVVAENDEFIAFIPYAALSPFHLWIFPKTHTACFATLADAALLSLAEIFHSVLARLRGLLDDPPFNLVVRSLAPEENDLSSFHWYISIVARVNKAAGLELGTGMYVNPSLPEQSAQALREFRLP